MARLLAFAIAMVALANSTNAMDQYDQRQCAQIINQLTTYRQANAFKQIIPLARVLASYCQSSLPLALEALATGLNGDNQHEEALAVANRCLQMINADVQLLCWRDKAEALYGLGRVQDAKATVERALWQPAVMEWDVKTKESLREFLAELALLWQIFSVTGFPNQFFCDSWAVGFWRADHEEHIIGLGSRACPTIVLKYREAREPTLRLSYSGIPRHTDRHQTEFCIVAMVRLSRELNGRQFLPERVSMIHTRSTGLSKFARFLGKNIEFGSDADEVAFPALSAEWALVNADPRLNKILLKVCEESLSSRKCKTGAFRVTVENTIAPLLPHGQAHASVVAKKLGMSERTLARRLAEEGVTFVELLQQLKASLASRYLEDDGMSISRIAWLLGFEEVSSFSHACRRWTGKSPRELRHFDKAVA